ncbi:hypothetical protein ABZ815_37450 [Nonomuraea sp. NPDC047529]|uniref:hypothetical protein n=1 Tax=Nonomuraea sp. NPDC047529 TaxID=3155623 RepID=UPI0033FF3B10
MALETADPGQNAFGSGAALFGPARVPGTNGQLPRHGGEFVFGDLGSWDEPDVATEAETRLYGRATAWSWDRLHPRLTRRAAWVDSAELPTIEGTVILLEVDHLPSGAVPKPVWSRTAKSRSPPAGLKDSSSIQHLPR